MKDILLAAALLFTACTQESIEPIQPDRIVRIATCPHGNQPAVLKAGTTDLPTPSCPHGDMKRCAESEDGGKTWHSWDADLDGWCRQKPRREDDFE